jgi:hypothetical protein
MTKQGKTPVQIRGGIERKEFESIDLQQVASAPAKAILSSNQTRGGE